MMNDILVCVLAIVACSGLITVIVMEIKEEMKPKKPFPGPSGMGPTGSPW